MAKVELYEIKGIEVRGCVGLRQMALYSVERKEENCVC